MSEVIGAIRSYPMWLPCPPQDPGTRDDRCRCGPQCACPTNRRFRATAAAGLETVLRVVERTCSDTGNERFLHVARDDDKRVPSASLRTTGLGRAAKSMTAVGVQQQQGGIGAYGAEVRFVAVRKQFGNVVAVDSVSLDIAPGEFLTLLGPSGSGKTTTLMMLAGFEIPTDGEIYVDETAIAAIPPYKRNIGMVFQNYALFPHMTVGENIAFPLKMRGLSKSEIARMSKEALELVKLPGYEGRYPRQLSGGQQQRIAVARALVFNPRVLADGRAAGRARQATAREPATGDQIAARPARRHDRLCHPRPAGSAGDVRPDCRHEQRAHRADRLAGGALRPTAIEVRGVVHRRVELPERAGALLREWPLPGRDRRGGDALGAGDGGRDAQVAMSRSPYGRRSCSSRAARARIRTSCRDGSTT